MSGLAVRNRLGVWDNYSDCVNCSSAQSLMQSGKHTQNCLLFAITYLWVNKNFLYCPNLKDNFFPVILIRNCNHGTAKQIKQCLAFVYFNNHKDTNLKWKWCMGKKLVNLIGGWRKKPLF